MSFVTELELDTADSIADVLRHRIELRQRAMDNETGAQLPLLTDPALVSNCGSAWHTYVDSCAHAISASVTEISEQSDADLSADQQLLEAAHREHFRHVHPPHCVPQVLLPGEHGFATLAHD